MAEEQEKESTSGGLRFRLPKLFAETVEEPDTSETGVGVEAIQASDNLNALAPVGSKGKSMIFKGTGANRSAPTTANPVTKESAGDSPLAPSSLSQAMADASALLTQMQAMQEQMQRMHEVVVEINDRENAHEKVFNTLHAELREYKTDFIYEHFKPVVRPLLFLYDSLEQFDAEIALYERPDTGERRQVGLSPQLVRDNIAFFRDQLAESLRICEVTPMETPTGEFNPKLHKVIDVVPADEEQDGIIQRVVRSGWYLNAQLLRPAEVIVGKKM